MQVADIVANVRDILQDRDDDARRYKDDSLIRGLNMAVLEIRRVRPDYFIGAYHNSVTQYSKLESEIQLPDTCLPSLVKYLAGWAELRDDEYTTDGRAAALLQAFATDLGVR
jgi:hypothetical protein